MENCIKEADFLEDLMGIFYNTEIYHGSLENNSIVFKASYDNQHLHFLLFDYESVYYSNQSNDEILSLNKSLNSSLEFNELGSLITFLVDNLIKAEEKLTISKQLCSDLIMFAYETVIDILNVKWLFSCKKINNSYLLAQNLFIKPLNNIIISFGYLINSGKEVIAVGKGNNVNAINIEDAVTLINNNYVNKNHGFSKLMIQLTKESTKKVNDAKYSKGKDKEKKEEQMNKRKDPVHLNKKRNKEYKIVSSVQFIEDKEKSSKDEDLNNEIINEKNNKKATKKKKKMNFI